MAGLFALALSKLTVHLLTNHNYGYFIDELYYIACSEHLDFGYVDHPPIIALVTWMMRTTFGDSLAALRFLPALAGAATVVVTGLIAKELGGNRFAQLLAGLSVIVCPLYLFMNTILSMNSIDILIWAVAAWLLALIITRSQQQVLPDSKPAPGAAKNLVDRSRQERARNASGLSVPQLWVILGVVIGVGLENKISVLFFCLALFAGLLVTAQRKHLRTPWPWLAAGIAAVIFLPHIIWQVTHGWPTLEFIERASAIKNRPMPLVEYLTMMALEAHPVNFIILLLGLWYFLLSRRGARFRLFGWIYLIILAVFLTQHAKPYYLGPAYPFMAAGGSVLLEAILSRARRAWLQVAVFGVVVLSGAAVAPMTLPVLPVESLIRYLEFFGGPPASSEQKSVGVLPQHFADMFGSEELVAEVAQVYAGLPVDDRQRCGIFGVAYPQAGAIDFFGDRYDLPKAISTHNSYWLWGPGKNTGEVMIVIGLNENMLRKEFHEVSVARVFRHPYVMPWRNNMPIHVCRRIRTPLKDLWPEWREFL